MSSQEKSFWMPRDEECLTGGVLGYTSSGITLFCNEKQAVDAGSSRPLSGLLNMNVLDTSSYLTGSAQLTLRLSQSEPVRTFNLVGRNTQSVAGNLDVERNPQYGDMSSVGLSMLHTIKDPLSCLNRAGIRSVDVNQVPSSDNEMSITVKDSYIGEDNNAISRGTTYSKSAKNILSGPTYSQGGESITSRNPAFNKSDDNFISTGNTNNGDGSFMLMGHRFNKIGDRIISTRQPLRKGDGSSISMDQQLEKEHGSIISTDPAYYKGHENFILIGHSHYNAHEIFLSMGHKGNNNVMSTGPTPDKADTSVVAMHTNYDKGSSSIQHMGRNNNKGGKNTISFGGFQDIPDTNPSGRTNKYDLFTSQPSGQASNEPGQKDLVECNNDTIVNVAPSATFRTRTVLENVQKMPKKVTPNDFPPHVKSLLSTGIFDGVPVKYFSWTRQKSLRAVIKGAGYLCGCNNCKFSKVLNAYEFERHAGFKTKHPNDRIYFKNGKTIYAVVQELRCTPREMLFEEIQIVTGSPINQKNFNIWKASYQAATRELQRIYGKDEVVMPTE